ncbi:hypothetical protein BHYA_0172g00140 [Botrytis hyacinthi]|uniref:J domain-containing protein n=1 Tax=Botrytis hyacinthi TaxID=278943 RepID=A0A4Z1GKN7_9HELO|nr:hypothetical protein BHYA_0172g00140 [Botrytis hyacinthi]
MASSEELSGLNTNYHEPKKGSLRLTIYEIYQVEQYEAQELFEFEQYVKIIRFAEAVCSGTHPRVGVFLQSDPGAHMTGAEASKEVDVEFKKIGFEELKTKKGLKPVPEADKKTRKKGYAEHTIMDAEDPHGARYVHDPDMDYYEVLSLNSSASTEDINKAYSELRRTYNPESDEGKTKCYGKEPTTLQDMRQKWISIQRVFMILSDHDRKWSYDNDRKMHLKDFERRDKKPDGPTAQIHFAAFRDEVVRSIGVPHPDDPTEPYNEDFFKSVTKGIIVEEKDINYDTNYYHDLGANVTKKSSSWNGVITHDYIRSLRHAKNQNAMDKVRSEWNQKLISYMILKDEKLRKEYNEQNNSHNFYEHLQKGHDSKELERARNSSTLVSEKIEVRAKSVSLQPATTGNYFRRLSTEKNNAFMEGVSDDGASASDMMTKVEQNTEIDDSMVITFTEKVSDRIQANPPTITDPQEKKSQQKLSVQITERSAECSKETRSQHPAVQDQAPKILRDQQAFFQKQLNAQRADAQSTALHRAEIQRSLGLDRAPPSGPRIPLGKAPRLMTSSFAHGLKSTSPLKLCPQLGLKMSTPPMVDKNAKITESPLQLSKGSEQRPAKKKRRVGYKNSDGKKEGRSAGKGDGSGSGSEVKLQDKGRVKGNRGERSYLKEVGEILENEREGETGGRQNGDKGITRDSGGKKHPVPDWHPNTLPIDWTTCPGWFEGQDKMLLKQMNDEGVRIIKAFDKAFEYDHDNYWIKEKVWKPGMSVAEVIHQVKMTLTGKKIKRRFKVDKRLDWTKPWINGTSLAKQERNTPNYDIVQGVYEKKHLAALDEEVIESLCEILKELAEKGFRVDPSLVSYGDSTAKNDKE